MLQWTLVYGRNQHNIVKQLSSNLKKTTSRHPSKGQHVSTMSSRRRWPCGLTAPSQHPHQCLACGGTKLGPAEWMKYEPSGQDNFSQLNVHCKDITERRWKAFKAAVSNLFDTRHWFHGRQFFHGQQGQGQRWFSQQYKQWRVIRSSNEKLCSFTNLLLTYTARLVHGPGFGDLCNRHLPLDTS